MEKLTPPVLALHKDYFIPITEKQFGVCGVVNYEDGCYDGIRYIDISGREWIIKDTQSKGWTNILQRLMPRKYRSIKVSFSFQPGRLYTLETLKAELEEFLLNRKLRGRPFLNKSTDIKLYLERFSSMHEMVSTIGYFDARTEHGKHLTRRSSGTPQKRGAP